MFATTADDRSEIDEEVQPERSDPSNEEREAFRVCVPSRRRTFVRFSAGRDTLDDVREAFRESGGYLLPLRWPAGTERPDAVGGGRGSGVAGVDYAFRMPPLMHWQERMTSYTKGVQDVCTWLAGFTAFGFIGDASTDAPQPLVVFLLMVALACFMLAICMCLSARWLAMETVTQDDVDAQMRDDGSKGVRRWCRLVASKYDVGEEWRRVPRRRGLTTLCIVSASVVAVAGLVLVMWAFAAYLLQASAESRAYAYAAVGVACLFSSLVVVIPACNYYLYQDFPCCWDGGRLCAWVCCCCAPPRVDPADAC